MVSNFQYIITCLAFSTGRPFRKAVWTNTPFLVSLVVLLAMGSLCLFAPDNSLMAKMFDLLPFTDSETGLSYYDYRAWLAVGILLNTIVTLGVESVLVQAIADRSETQSAQRQDSLFHAKMQALRLKKTSDGHVAHEPHLDQSHDDDHFVKSFDSKI